MAKKKASRKRQPAGGAKRAMTITSSGTRSIHKIASDLKAAGFQVGQVLDTIGSVTGFAHPELKEKLKRIEGVAHVEEDHEPIDIGPPDTPVS